MKIIQQNLTDILKVTYGDLGDKHIFMLTISPKSKNCHLDNIIIDGGPLFNNLVIEHLDKYIEVYNNSLDEESKILIDDNIIICSTPQQELDFFEYFTCFNTYLLNHRQISIDIAEGLDNSVKFSKTEDFLITRPVVFAPESTYAEHIYNGNRGYISKDALISHIEDTCYRLQISSEKASISVISDSIDNMVFYSLQALKASPAALEEASGKYVLDFDYYKLKLTIK